MNYNLFMAETMAMVANGAEKAIKPEQDGDSYKDSMRESQEEAIHEEHLPDMGQSNEKDGY